MAALRFSMLKSLGSCIKFARNSNPNDVRTLSSLISCTKFCTKESGFALARPLSDVNGDFKLMGLKGFVADQYYRNWNSCASTFSPMGENLISHYDFKLMSLKASVADQYYRNENNCASPMRSNLNSCGNISPFGGCSVLMSYRSYSSSPVGSQGNNTRDTEVPLASSSSGTDVSDGGFSGADWFNKIKDAWQSAVDTANYTGEKAKEASSELTPYAQRLLDTHPYLRDVIVPVACTLTGTMLAWFVLPRVLRRFHKYSTQGPAALLSGSSLWGPVPYENSFWGAMEDPLRYLVTFMAFSYIGMMVAPTTIASQYISQAWRGAVILSAVWFLHRWKTNVISRALAVKSTEGVVDRDKLLAIDKVSSVGLFVLGVMALAEACGVAVQSILTVGGIGGLIGGSKTTLKIIKSLIHNLLQVLNGVATAFASRDILGNVLSGLSVQMSQPFAVGDTIKAGSVEGQVIEMGLTTTRLLSAEKFPVIVPNSLFSSQVIVNKSRAGWRAMLNKIPLQIGDFDKIPQISEDIKNMLKSNSNVFLEKEVPFCHLSRVDRSYAELTLGYNIKHMRKDLLYAAEQDILLQSIRIIKQHGATLGSTWEDMTSQ